MKCITNQSRKFALTQREVSLTVMVALSESTEFCKASKFMSNIFLVALY